MSRFDYEWRLGDGYPAKGVKKHGTTVMSTFACGGGSTMGYKLAGYDVIAANDIDPKMKMVYEANHHPKQFFLCSAKDLLKTKNLPEIDVLDGSPPCSVFSTTGLRDKAWQQNKRFREGQTKQVLDDLFFDFIDLAKKMNPKIVIAENVKGMLIGNAKWYTREIFRRFGEAGYGCQVFLLNAATMGVPQKRERVFFIANRLNQRVQLKFNDDLIPFELVQDATDRVATATKLYHKFWNETKPGHAMGKFKSDKKLHPKKPANTMGASGAKYHHSVPRKLNKLELCRIGSWPLDYEFMGVSPQYLIGMSVPPVMMAQVAHQVYEQLLAPVNSGRKQAQVAA